MRVELSLTAVQAAMFCVQPGGKAPRLSPSKLSEQVVGALALA